MVPPPGGVSTEMTPGYLMDRKSKDSTNPTSFLFDFMRKYCACVCVSVFICMCMCMCVHVPNVRDFFFACVCLEK